MAVYTDVSAEDLADFLAGYDLGELLSYKGIAEGVENSNFLVHTSRGNYILTLYEKRVAPEDLPFFLALMEHLAARGLTCPQPVKNRTGEHARHGRGPAGRDRDVPRRHVDPPPERGALRARSARRWRSCILPGAIFRCGGATRSRSTAGARSTWHCGARRRHGCSRDLRETIERELTMLEGAWPQRPAAGRDPRRSVSRQRVLPRRQAVRA